MSQVLGGRDQVIAYYSKTEENQENLSHHPTGNTEDTGIFLCTCMDKSSACAMSTESGCVFKNLEGQAVRLIQQNFLSLSRP